ncbi:hypothetical protein RB600_008464 [Gaeumannomyces tritici]
MGALRRSKCKWPLDALLVTTHAKFQASDQRDKVYGILGLATEWQDETAHPAALRPDYSLDVADVYQRATRFLLEKGSSLSMMAISRGTNGNLMDGQKLHELNLPSWTPDWSDFRLFKGITKTPFCWASKASGSSLRVAGLVMGEIAHTLRFNPKFVSKQQFDRELDHRMGQVLELALETLADSDLSGWTARLAEVLSAKQHSLGSRDWEQICQDGVAYLCTLLTSNGSGETS